jgi:EAL domain-containing protein (putative c-di-GMP-specific phosphodiesterase class I)/GGDEF domain-containing protein
MATRPFVTRLYDRIDRTTGLPLMGSALTELPRMIRENQPDKQVGIIALAIVPDPLLFRQSTDSMHKLRIQISQQIQATVRPQDKVYSLSQREWLIIQPNLLSSAATTLAMLRLRDKLMTGSDSGISHTPKLALGAALWPEHGDDALFLVQSARIARLTAERGNPDVLLYHPRLDTVDENEQSLLPDLHQALTNGRGLSLYLQPQMEIQSGRCIGAEALLRWQRNNGEWVAPPRVLEALDRLGQRQTFNRWLLHHASQIQKQLVDHNIDITLSLNLSANDLLDVELPDMIAQALATWDLNPTKFLLEITETIMIEESWQVMDVLNRLRGLGLRLSIDDFGTGYAGMGYLQRLPVQEVKIDQVFVRQLENSAKGQEIVASVIQLARKLEMSVIAEGVETQETLDILQTLGCRFGQGFYYSPALPPPDFINWWKARQTPPNAGIPR